MSEKRLYKMQLMLNDSELKEIDDWRFENHADSRSAAVRALIKQSLLHWREGQADNATDDAPDPSKG